MQTYGENSKEYRDAKAAAMSELNQAKGYLANEFFVKPFLNVLATYNPIGSTERGIIDYLRGVPNGTTKADIIDFLGTGMSVAINT